MSEPTNGELHIMLTNISEKLDTVIIQVLKTNGRVSSLESWKNKLIGGFIVTNIILVPVAVTLLSKIVT